MKKTVWITLTLALALCVLAVPFTAYAAETPVNLMPTAGADFTVVSGDGTVTVENGVATITNNGDADLRVTFKNETKFDMTKLTTLHMNFETDMTFKMAYHIIGSDASSAWPNTTDTFGGQFTIEADRVQAGTYDNLNLNLNDACVSLTDKSAVYFNEFIILLSGKGTFTMKAVEMTDGTTTSGSDDNTTTASGDATTTVSDATTTAASADNTTAAPATTTAAPATTTVAKTTAANATGDSAKTDDVSNAMLFALIAVLAAGAVTGSVALKKNAAR